MTISMWIATIAWLLLLLGYFQRFHRSRHVPLMISGIAIDISLVAYLEVTRDAINTALAFRLELLQQLHIACSSAALLLYFPVIYLGFRLLRNPTPRLRQLHIRLASAALILRSGGFLLMFSMLER